MLTPEALAEEATAKLMTHDEAEIEAIIARDVEAYLAKDFATLASLYLKEDRMVSVMQIASSGLIRSWGYDQFMSLMKRGLETERKPSRSEVKRSNLRIKVSGDMAWASFNQDILNSADPTDPPAFTHNIRVFERTTDGWKIAFHGVFEPQSAGTRAPSIEVDAKARVLSINAAAEARLPSFEALTISHGTLRAVKPSWDKSLRVAIERAATLSTYSVLHSELGRGRRPEFPVILGEDDDGALLVCIVSVTDFSVHVSFDDPEALGRRLDMARIVYGLSDAQTQLAREIADGHDLAEASARLGVTPNTARTHLRRMFDKTGARSQTALLRIILSLG